MSFQFACPHGHLLEGDPSQAGQQIICPVCQQLFIIPSAAPPSEPSAFADPTESSPFSGPTFGPQEDSPAQPPFALEEGQVDIGLPQVGPKRKVVGDVALEKPKIFHIPCPKCKEELETPPDMLDENVLCPHCESQFILREHNSIEHKLKEEEKAKLRELKMGKKWLNGAITIAIFIFIFLAVLIGISILN